MNRNLVTIALLLAGIAIGAAFGQARAQGTPPADSFEYQHLPAAPGGIEDEMKSLNQLGAQGWAIAGIKDRNGNGAEYLLVRHKR